MHVENVDTHPHGHTIARQLFVRRSTQVTTAPLLDSTESDWELSEGSGLVGSLFVLDEKDLASFTNAHHP